MLTYIPSAIREGKTLLKSGQFDIINTHFVLPTGPVGHTLSRMARIPNVLSLHGGDLYDPSKFLSPHRHAIFRTTIRRLLRGADMVVGQSNNTLGNMHRYYTPEIQGERIPLAIQRPAPEAGAREAYGFADDDVLLATVGRLIPRKGIDQLISMVQTLRQHHKPVRLLIIGAGPEEQHLRQAAASRGVAEYIHFMGFVEEAEKNRLLNMSDVYVSTSQHEGFGLVFLEGMACGLPVVCYNHGGQTDFLRDGETGYLVALNDLDTFTERCQLLVENAALRKKMSGISREYVEEYFIENCARKHEAIFSQTIEAHRAGERAWMLNQRTALGSD
jgi:glycosyltransferase involved in cell wall biosynthesis